ncbi:hypothetical protein [Roseburia intestinalis]
MDQKQRMTENLGGRSATKEWKNEQQEKEAVKRAQARRKATKRISK